MAKLVENEVERIAQGEPLAYVLGNAHFYGHEFKVTKDVLIPRQETEILVNLVAWEITKRNMSHLTLWDLCTGTGCIGISLKKKFPSLEVVLSDMSEKALKIAEENARSNQVEVEIVQGDLFKPFQGRHADLIVSNPPYVTENEYLELDPSVKDYEPKSALVAADEGLYFYKQFAHEFAHFINPLGALWLEIGYQQSAKMKEIFQNPKIFQDLAGHDRFIRVEIS
jgi:release factor glutamine methyltransferase